MKNVTVSLDDGTYRRAKLRAAERSTSLSALVRDFLDALGTEETEFDRLKREEHRLREELASYTPGSAGFSAADRLTRNELYDQARARADHPDGQRD